MNNVDTKKGIIGILNLTNAPKLEVVRPIINANKIEKVIQNNKSGF
jgi:hypothetical protein